MMKNSIIFLFLGVFSFLSLAGVRSIYHRGENIYIEYDAQYEFSADKFLSALEQEEKKVSQLNPHLTDFVKNQCVILPVCSKEDQVCLQYVAKVDRIRKNIKDSFQRERILYEQKQAIRTEDEMLENNLSHIKASIEQNQWQLRIINIIQDLLLTLMNNQNHVFKILKQFREVHPNIEYSQSNTIEQITEMKEWLATHYPDDTVLLNFLNTTEKIYKADFKVNTQMTSDLNTLLFNGNSEVLDTFWQFTNEMESTVIMQIDSLVSRKEMEMAKITVVENRRQQIERERQDIWIRIKAQSAHRVYPQSPVLDFSVCYNCLVP